MYHDIQWRPNDLRRHSAIFASRSEASIEIDSKVIMRHAHLSTTQRYFEKVPSDVFDTGVRRWIR
jgi:hypothetical protein